MLKAFKIYELCPIATRPPNIPLDWPWLVIDIADEDSASYVAQDFLVMSNASYLQYKADRQDAFNLWANTIDITGAKEELRVYDLVQKEFRKLHPSKIDFRRHLKPNIYLQKNVIMLPNGRPQKSIYSYNGEIIAEIEFSFETNIYNFMSRRTEKLSYYKITNLPSEQWVIADDFYDQNNPYHLREMMRERSGGRASIIEEIKSFLNGVLAQFYIPQGKTYPEILTIAGEFWETYSLSINSWINVGAPQFRDLIEIEDSFPFLDYEISEGVTVKMYIMSKVTY